MKTMQTCRICLAVQVKMYKMGNEAIKSFIENIFKSEGFTLDLDASHYVCFECKGLLNKSYNFIQKALRAQREMYKILMKHKKVSLAALQNLDRRKLGILSNLSTHEVKINLVIEDNNDDNIVPLDLKPDGFNNLIQEIEIDTKPILADLMIEVERDISEPDVLKIKKEKVESIIQNDSHSSSEEENIETKKEIYVCERSFKKIPAIKFNNIVSRCGERSNNYTDSMSKWGSRVRKCKSVKKQRKIEGGDFETGTMFIEFPYYGYDDDGKRIVKPKDNRVFPMECEQCKCEIETRVQHYRHYALYHPTIKYPYAPQKTCVCQFCGKKYMNMPRLRQHELVHGEKTIKCLKCDQMFHSRTRMLAHSRIVHVDPMKMVTCDYCQKKFKDKCALRLHIRTHTGEKPYKCHICGAGFAHNGNVGIHIRSNHQNENGQGMKKGRPKKGDDKIKKKSTKTKNKEFATVN